MPWAASPRRPTPSRKANVTDEAFRIVIAVAVGLGCLSMIVQALSSYATYRSVRRMKQKMEPLVDRLEPIAGKVGPVVDNVRTVLERAAPAIEKIGPVIQKA